MLRHLVGGYDRRWLMVWTAPYGISCARMRLLRSQTREPSVNQIIRIGMDTSKHFFQLHGVDATERPVLRRRLRRNEVLPFFAKQSPTVIGMEACGAGHYWARELRKLGHEVKLIAPQHVKAYVKRNKNDGRDAEGLCEAMSRPTMQFVPVKTEEQQAALMLAGVRQQRITRTRPLQQRNPRLCGGVRPGHPQGSRQDRAAPGTDRPG